MRFLSVGDVARRTGVRHSVLRYYEQARILPAPARVSGRRSYHSVAVRRVEILRFAQQAGLSLEEIKTLFHRFGAETPPSGRWKSLARTKPDELDLLGERIRRMRGALETGLRRDCARIEECTLSPMPAPQARGKLKRLPDGRPC